MSTSTAPAVKNALLGLMQADANLTGVRIDYADPGDEIGQEQIFFGRTLGSEQPAPGMGQRRQEENYEIEVYVYVAADGNDPQAVEDRAYAIVAELETLVRANNGPTGALAAVITGGGWAAMSAAPETMTPFTFGGQRVCEALCRVKVKARKAP